MTNTEPRKTAWYVVDDNDDFVTIDGHMWFSQDIARQLGRETGNMWYPSSTRGIKTVVVAR